MAKINFKQPKFIIPLILFPFLLLSFFVFSSWKAKSNKGKMSLEDSLAIIKEKGFNTDMPGVSKEIKDATVKDKFAAYQEVSKNQKDYSALNNLNVAPIENQNKITSSYNQQDIEKIEGDKRIDSMRKELEQRRNVIEQRINGYSNSPVNQRRKRNFNTNSSANQSDQEILNALKRQAMESNQSQALNNENSDAQPKGVGGSYEEQMKFFKEQMKMVDSMQKANSPKKNEGDAEHSGVKFNPGHDTSFKPLPVSTVDAQAMNGFNTVTKFKAEDNIKAIIDQSVKVIAGARVRIKLLQDIYVGENIIPAGTFIYSIVTGFQTSRINLTITSINFNGTPLPVKLDVFDNDGYIGLYVPNSNFREFTKEIGTQSTQGLSSIQSSNGSTDISSSLLSKVFTSSTNTVGKLISQNKVFLKADYIIYLKENKSTSKF